MFGLRLCAPLATRSFSTSSATLNVKVPVALIAQLRKAHPVPMGQAREALEKANLDVDKAIAYLTSASGASAQKKADKVAGRSTTEGAIAVSILGGRRVGMVHLACETDFVARNDVFRSAAKSIADTAAFLDVPSDVEPIAPADGADPIQLFPVEQLLSAPVISHAEGDGGEAARAAASAEGQTVKQMLVSSVSQTGENLKLQRAVSFASPFPAEANRRFVPGVYTHGGDASTGKVGGVVILSVKSTGDVPVSAMVGKQPELETDLNTLARNIARQAVGFPTKALQPTDGVAAEEALLTQPAMMLGSDKPISEVVDAWAADRGLAIGIVALRRWSTSDAVEDVPAQDA